MQAKTHEGIVEVPSMLRICWIIPCPRNKSKLGLTVRQKHCIGSVDGLFLSFVEIKKDAAIVSLRSEDIVDLQISFSRDLGRHSLDHCGEFGGGLLECT